MATKKNPFSPTTEKDGSVSFYVRVMHSTPDTVQYKPYSTTIEPYNLTVLIRVVVPAEHVILVDQDTVILTPIGWFSVTKQIATGSIVAYQNKV